MIWLRFFFLIKVTIFRYQYDRITRTMGNTFQLISQNFSVNWFLCKYSELVYNIYILISHICVYIAWSLPTLCQSPYIQESPTTIPFFSLSRFLFIFSPPLFFLASSEKGKMLEKSDEKFAEFSLQSHKKMWRKKQIFRRGQKGNIGDSSLP